MNLTLSKRRKGSTVFAGRPGRPTILRWPNVNPNLLKMDSLMDKDFIDGVFSLVLYSSGVSCTQQPSMLPQSTLASTKPGQV